GYSAEDLDAANRAAMDLARRLAAGEEAPEPAVLAGVIGPRGDGYVTGERMTAEAARGYHAPQIRSLARGGADMVAAYTLTYAEEGVGIALAAGDAGVPASISFTVETDGRLPSGEPLGEAIERVDALAGGAVA